MPAHDLEQLHHRRRVEEVEPDRPLRRADARAELGERERRRVRRRASACGGATSTASPRSFTLSSMFSGAASMTRSTPSHAARTSVATRRAPRAPCRAARSSSCPCRPASRAARRTAATACSARPGTASKTRVAKPADAVTCAIPCPIVPVPRTHTVRIDVVTRRPGRSRRLRPGLQLDQRRAARARRPGTLALW